MSLSQVTNFLKAVPLLVSGLNAAGCKTSIAGKKVESFLSYLVDLEFLAVEVDLTLGKSFFDGEC